MEIRKNSFLKLWKRLIGSKPKEIIWDDCVDYKSTAINFQQIINHQNYEMSIMYNKVEEEREKRLAAERYIITLDHLINKPVIIDYYREQDLVTGFFSTKIKIDYETTKSK